MIDIAKVASHLETLLRTDRQVHQFRSGTPTGIVSVMPGAPTGFVLETCSVEPKEQIRLEFSLAENPKSKYKRLIVQVAVPHLERQWANRGSNEEVFAKDLYVLIQEAVEQGAYDRLLESTDPAVTIELGRA